MTELATRIRDVVDGSFRQTWIKGEVIQFRRYQSGHCWFCIRDAMSQIRCVMWKTYAVRLPTDPPEGIEVFIQARPAFRTDKGEIQLSVTVLLPTSGLGLQQVARERTREALERDGLLDPGRKRPLPPFPGTIAVVTSPDGAALHDLVSVARRRWPAVRIWFLPVRVQGETAPRELVRALRLVNQLVGVDLCVIGRGGGGREDLIAFDDERVCRAVAALRVPTISAVGHEVDVPLTDLVADARAPTPSAAMEMALPDRSDVRHQVEGLAARLATALRRRSALLGERLARSADRMEAAVLRRLERPRADLAALSGRLDALSPLRVLSRGYSLARLPDGRLARVRADLPPGTPFTLRVSDGDVPARAEPAG
ncbi:MAG: exodeoxyribonuclease VII large subunit [Gemmatimonadales bacterium]